MILKLCHRQSINSNLKLRANTFARLQKNGKMFSIFYINFLPNCEINKNVMLFSFCEWDGVYMHYCKMFIR